MGIITNKKSLSRPNFYSMKVALVHDYLGEFGGAERVLLTLSEIWPQAPIYTAFYRNGPAWERFKGKDIRVSWAHHIPGFSSKLHSPLRFLAPLIWNSFDFSVFDVVISSASWYITKGFKKGPKTIEVCYCHTPPRYLYGYKTSLNWQKYWPIRLYASIVNHFMRLYDFSAAQRVDYFVANSQNTRRRIQKFYRKDATVIYPPVELNSKFKIQDSKRGNYYLVVARIVGAKGLEMAVEAANSLRVPLKIVGAPAGYTGVYKELKKRSGKNVEFLGYVSDEKLAKLYAGAKAFLALAQDEDFGITPVEAMAAGTPVIAFRGGGYLESVVEGKTGIFFDEYNTRSLVEAIKKLDKIHIRANVCQQQAKKFSKDRFKKQIKEFVLKHARTT